MSLLTDIVICLSIVCWPLTPLGMAILWAVAWAMARHQAGRDTIAMSEPAGVTPAKAESQAGDTTFAHRASLAGSPADFTHPSWPPARHAHASR